MNRSEQRGFDLAAVPKYPWEDGEEWDQRRFEEIQRRLDGEKSEYPHVHNGSIDKAVRTNDDGSVTIVTHLPKPADNL